MLTTPSSIYSSLSPKTLNPVLIVSSAHVQHWFLAHDLLLNRTKYAASYCDTQQRRLNIFNLPLNNIISDSNILVHDHLNILQLIGRHIVDTHFTFVPHTQSVVSSATIIFRSCVAFVIYCHVMSLIPCIACGIVGSRFDFCNSLLYGSTDAVLNSLQRVQNNLARTVLHSGSYNNSLSNLCELHWLPVHERIRFEIANLCYRACMMCVLDSHCT